jgi:hypothetical protein
VFLSPGDPGSSAERSREQALRRSRAAGWLPDIGITDLRVGKQKFDIHFWREGIATRWNFVKGDADVVMRRSFSTGSHLHPDR